MIQQNLEGEKKGQASFGNPEKRKKPKPFPEQRKAGLATIRCKLCGYENICSSARYKKCITDDNQFLSKNDALISQKEYQEE